MSPVWNRLIRFVAADSKVYYGEPIISGDSTVDKLFESGSLEAKVVTGDIFADDAVVTDQVAKVTKLLAPLSKEEIPIIKCVGLNYKAHSMYFHYCFFIHYYFKNLDGNTNIYWTSL